MKCPNCNFEIAENTKFCPECGQNFFESDIHTQNKLKKLSFSSFKPLSDKKKKIIKCSLISSLIVIFLGLVSYFGVYPLIEQANGNYSVIINMYNIEEYKIPNNTTKITQEAFHIQELKSLKKIIIPDSVTHIDKRAFEYLHVEEVVIGNGVTSIEEGTFSHCENLKSISLPTGLVNIGDFAFSDCVSLKRVIFYKDIVSIGSHAFSNCESLENIEFYGSVTTIEDYAFSGCKKLTIVNLSRSNLTSISAGMFNGCENLFSVSLPDGLLRIESGAFLSCDISDLKIPEGVTHIGSAAFSWNEDMIAVVLPKSLKTIEQTAFFRCGLDDGIYYAGTKNDWNRINIDWNLNDVLKQARIYYNYVPSY